MDPIEPQINEILLRQKNGWLHFTQPHQVFIVHALEGVIPALREIERLTSSHGWHAAGFLSYESAPAFDPALQTRPATGFPCLWFGLYPPPHPVDLPAPAAAKPALSWLPSTARDTYNTALEKIKDHIAHGRTYQVNYTMRLKSDFRTAPWELFLHLAQSQNKHAAYLDCGRYVIACASPELFFELDGETITARPMKGTVQRGRTNLEDREKADWLHHSEKNRAENVMIVDMIRNDLGRIARAGSVHVPELFTIERYPTLWQMTSLVQAQTDASITDIFKALFPCASITGAPKVSTMRIIAELETTPRQIYTGTIGHIAPSRRATFNVAIRTALIDRRTQSAEYGAGGGIVWDSTSTDEYAEALLKARVLTESPAQFSLLETMLWTPGEGFFLREKHVARLLASAEYFDFPLAGGQRQPDRPQDGRRAPRPKDCLEAYLDHAGSRFTSPQRVRLLLDRGGNLSHEARPFQPDSRRLRVRLAEQPVNSNDVFLFHKTTHREAYENAFPSVGCGTRADEAVEDVLLFNERHELTEFTLGNLVLELDGQRVTPPVSCGLLAGTFRAHLLETGQVVERVVHVEQLGNCTEVLRINSVRKWQRVEWI